MSSNVIVKVNGASVKLSKHSQGGFRKFVWGRMFALGMDQYKAAAIAQEIARQAEESIADGEKVWGDTALAIISHVTKAVYGDKEARYHLEAMALTLHHKYPILQKWLTPLEQVEQEIIQAANPNAALPLMQTQLYTAIDAFVEAKSQQAVSEIHKEQVTCRMGRVKFALADMPLAAFGVDQISQIVNIFACQCKEGKLSKATSGNYISTFRQFVDWLDMSDSPRFKAWQAPRRFETLFNVKLTSPATGAAHTPAMTVDQIGQLWKAANARQRLYLLLGLNCGYTQEDIASLTADMIGPRWKRSAWTRKPLSLSIALT
jgi:hypothetical protein